jgi:membrane associated rhomboid family serine protease
MMVSQHCDDVEGAEETKEASSHIRARPELSISSPILTRHQHGREISEISSARDRLYDIDFLDQYHFGNEEANNRVIERFSDGRNTSRTCNTYSKFLSKYPWFTLTMLILIWAFFIRGLRQQNLTWSSPISPYDEQFWFRKVDYWPSCAKLSDSSWWLLLSYQFAHDGLGHIGGNSLLLLWYGCVNELTQPLGLMAVVVAYVSGVVFGALTYSYVFPYNGLIGCSAGIYALIGLTVASALVNRKYMNPRFHFSLLVLLGLQMIVDILSYFVFYKPGTAYAAHCGALFFGFFAGVSFTLPRKFLLFRALAIAGIACYLLFGIFLLYSYVADWPPKKLSYNPTFHAYDPGSCCSDLFEIAKGYSSVDKVRNLYICTDSGLVYDGPSRHE